MTTDAQTGLLEHFIRSQDAEAFAAITRQYGGMVYGTCVRITGNEERAADATQETFFHLVKHARQVSGSLTGWLHHVAVGKSVNQVRSDVARRRREEEYAAQPRETDQWSEVSPLVDEALQELDEEPREILVRHYLQGETLTDIAASKKISQPTMSRRAEQALEQLRERLRNKGVLVAVVVLGGLMTNAASAVPAAVLAELGKMALAASGAAAAGAASGAAVSALKVTAAIGVAVAVLVVGTWIAWRSFVASENTSAASPPTNALGFGGIAVRQQGTGGGWVPYGGGVGPTGQPMGFGGMAMAGGGPAPMITPLTALELLDKFAAAQAPLKSFIAVEEVAGRNDGISRAVDGDFGMTNEIRLDENRVAERSWTWGALGGTKANPNYTSRLTDGQRVLFYDQQPAPGKLVIMPESVGWLFRLDPVKRAAESMGRSFLRQAFGVIDPGDRRIDLKLRTASDLRLRPKLEPAGWAPSPCYVLEGETDTGHYTLWLDPARGYQLARALVQRRPDHLGPNGRPFGGNAVSTVEKVRYEMREGLWLPVELSSRMESSDRGRRTLQTFHIEVTRFTLNPDHAALRSFVPDDVRDGTKVTIVGDNRQTKAEGVWRAGRVLDNDEKVLWTPESLAGSLTNKPPRNSR